MRLILIIIFLVAGVAGDLSATILSSRPRVWIDSTIKARLQADAVANTTEWQNLKNYCDSNLASANGGVYKQSGYHGLDWYNLVMSYGLCFQATGNQTYGNEGVVYVKGLLRDNADAGVIGDGLGGDLEIRVDSGYVSRSLGTGVAVGRDWLDGATSMDATLIGEINTRMATWWTWIAANAHAIADPRDNYFYGHFAMVYTSAFSLYGDAGYQSSWLTDAESRWTNYVLPLINNGHYDGGDDAKGWNYSPWAYQEMVGYMLARDTATDESTPWADTNIHEDLARSQVHFLYPDRGRFSDTGMWSADIKGDPRSALSIFLAAMTPIDSTRKGTLRWFADSITYEPNKPEVWQKFLYKVSDISPVTPSASNMGSLAYTTNIGHFVARSADWLNTNASFVEFFAYQDRLNNTEGFTNGDYAIGDIRFFSRGVGLIEDGDREQFTGHYQNQLHVTGSHTYAPYQEPWLAAKSGVSGYASPAFSSQSVDGQYAFAKIKRAKNAYDGTYWTNTPSLSNYDRSMLAIWPDTVIVYDNAISTSSSNDVSIRWWFPRQPTVSSNTLTTTHASADLKLSVLGLDGSFGTPGTSYDLMAVTGTSTYRAGYYYADFSTTGTPTNNQSVTVIQATDHGVSPPVVSEISGTGGRGAKVGNTVAMFTDSQTGADISTLEYTTDATTHYIADLPKNSSIVVTKNSVTVSGSPFSSGTAGIVSFSAASGSGDYRVTISGAEPVCDSGHLDLCDSGNCAGAGGYWYDSTCNASPLPTGRRYRYLSISGD